MMQSAGSSDRMATGSQTEQEGTNSAKTGILSRVVTAVLVGLTSFAAASLGIEWTREAGNIASLWPPNAIFLAILLARPSEERLPNTLAFAVAIILANLSFGDSLSISTGLALANFAEIMTAYWLARHFGFQSFRFDSLKWLGGVFVFYALVAPGAGATVGAGVIHAGFGAPYLLVWTTWWAADAMGMIVFFPLAAVLLKNGIQLHAVGGNLAEALLAAVIGGGIVWFVFGQYDLYALLLLLPVLLWISIRMRVPGAAAAVTLCGISLTWLTISGLGPIGQIAELSITQKVQDLHYVLLTFSLPTIVVAAVLERNHGLVQATTESERRFRHLYNDSPVMLHSIDAHGQLVSVSQFWLDKMGYSRNEVIGRHSAEFLDKESQRRITGEVLPRLSEGGAIRDYGCRFITKGGKEIDALMSAVRERGPARGEARSLVGIVDITDRKTAEEKLAATVEELERSNRDLEQFAFLASHDLQEPLRMVKSFTELLQEDYGSTLDDRAREYIYFAHDGATRMSQMVQDLLYYSRVTQEGHVDGSVDIGVAVASAVAELKSATDQSNAMITYSELPTISGSSLQIASLFQNIISNSIKYKSDSDPVINISAERQGLFWHITVADNGIGIDPRHHERIFGLFKRLHQRDEFEGTGIGLAICRKVVERHGGKIWVESQVGSGAKFHMTLPAVTEESPRDDG